MPKTKSRLFDNLNAEVTLGIRGFKLCAYLIALEGWRRGLELKFYKDETAVCKMHRLNSSTHGKFFSLSNGSKTHYFFRSRGDKVSNKSVRICQNKEETKELLRKSNVPIPQGGEFDINYENKIIDYAENIGYPVVLKPLSGSMGRGVYMGINNKSNLLDAIRDTRSRYRYKKYLLEKYYPGQEYRVYVVGDRVVGATNRIPANIIGNGKDTVEILIEKKNKQREKNPYLASKPIKVDFEVEKCLESYKYQMGSIPKKGETVFLREKSNLSSGGDPIEATDELTEEVQQIAVNALKALPSIPHAGVDVIVNPKDNKKGVVLEINATAEISFHTFPLTGEAKDVPGAIVDYYFPETIEKEKTDLYFDYNSLLAPLETWAAEEILVSKPPMGKLYGKKYIVSGKVRKVGYISWIKRQALRRNFLGYVKKAGKNQLEIVIVSEDKEKVDKFIERCKKGSKKSRVDQVEEQELDVDLLQPLKLGFEVI